MEGKKTRSQNSEVMKKQQQKLQTGNCMAEL